MQIFIHCKATLHVSGVTAPIIRSIKNCTRNLRYRSYYLYRYSPPTWSDLDCYTVSFDVLVVVYISLACLASINYKLVVPCILIQCEQKSNRCDSTQIFSHCKTTLHVSGVTAPIIRRRRSPDQTTLEGSSDTSSMTCTGGCGYSF